MVTRLFAARYGFSGNSGVVAPLPAMLEKRLSGTPAAVRISRMAEARPTDMSHGYQVWARPDMVAEVCPVTAIGFDIRRKVGTMASSTLRVRS